MSWLPIGPGFGDRMAALGGSPQGVMGLQALIAGHRAAEAAREAAMAERIGLMEHAQEASQRSRDAMSTGRTRAGERRQRTASELEGQATDWRSDLAGRAPAMNELMDSGMGDWMGYQASQSAPIGQGGTDLFADAMANVTRGNEARSSALDSWGRAAEMPSHFDFDTERSLGDMGWTARRGRSDERGIMDRARMASSAASREADNYRWRASQVRERIPLQARLMQSVGPMMMREGMRAFHSRPGGGPGRGTYSYTGHTGGGGPSVRHHGVRYAGGRPAGYR